MGSPPRELHQELHPAAAGRFNWSLVAVTRLLVTQIYDVAGEHGAGEVDGAALALSLTGLVRAI
jgi:hypothetical protein